MLKIPKKKLFTKEMVWDCNRTGHIGFSSKTTNGSLKTTERQRNEQGRVLHHLKPGSMALREIQFYQHCETFLIPVVPFQRLAREVCDEDDLRENPLRWQSIALFTLQSASEAYLAGFIHDANLCAIHYHVITINHKDIWHAI